MNKINIWLDDVRPEPDGWLLAATSSECIELLKQTNGCVNILSLDHDLGGIDKGHNVAKFLVEGTIEFPKEIYLHTSNPTGRLDMFYLLKNYANMFKLDTTIYNGLNVIAWDQSTT
jgi:hypothetical protein